MVLSRGSVIKKAVVFFLFVFWIIACSEEKEETELLYAFPTLPYKQLNDLKKKSEKMEGFFLTTDLSDWDSSYSERGAYLYVCIRFLNDPAVNDKLKKSAIPLLVQVSINNETAPMAESVVLFHPQTINNKSQKRIFYYEEREKFQLKHAPVIIKNKAYNVFDVEFNNKNRITRISFIQQGVKPEELNRVVFTEAEDEKNSAGEPAKEEPANGEEDKKDLVLQAGAFAKISSSSCENWARLNYKHSQNLPDYLKPPESAEGTSDKGVSVTSHDSRSPGDSTSSVTPLAPLSEDTPHIQVNKEPIQQQAQ